MKFIGIIEMQKSVVYLTVPGIAATSYGSNLKEAFKALQTTFYIIFRDEQKEFAQINCIESSKKSFILEILNIEKMLPLILDRIKSSSNKSFRELVDELGYKSTGSITSYFKNKNPSFSKACQLLSSLGYEVTISPKS